MRLVTVVRCGEHNDYGILEMPSEVRPPAFQGNTIGIVSVKPSGCCLLCLQRAPETNCCHPSLNIVGNVEVPDDIKKLWASDEEETRADGERLFNELVFRMVCPALTEEALGILRRKTPGVEISWKDLKKELGEAHVRQEKHHPN